MDDGFVEYEMLDEALEELMDAIDREMEEEEGPLLGLIHNCIRCGSPTAYQISETEYKCPECGMEWEILIHG
jgi:rubrerythrin